jgi:TPR repeat protein
MRKRQFITVYYYEKAAIRGHPTARFSLGTHEGKNGRGDRAVKHMVIAAKLGCEESMRMLWVAFKDDVSPDEFITKENLEATLRAHQAAVDAMKSPKREEAAVFYGMIGFKRN